MPRFNCTRRTRATLAASFRWLAARWTFFVAALRKVFSMLDAVAYFTKRFSVGNFKSKLWKVSPRLNVMPVKPPLVPTSNALETIATKYGSAPFSPFGHEPCSLIPEGLTAFPVSGEWPNKGLARASSRAKTSTLVTAIKSPLAVCAFSRLRWISFRPACLAAKLRSQCAVFVLHVIKAAYRASKRYTAASGWNRDSLPGAHYSRSNSSATASMMSHKSCASMREDRLPLSSSFCTVAVTFRMASATNCSAVACMENAPTKRHRPSRGECLGRARRPRRCGSCCGVSDLDKCDISSSRRTSQVIVTRWENLTGRKAELEK